MHLGSRTFESISSAIVSGELAAGETLRDRTLGELLGVSRTPVREALHRLEDAGLVESRGRAGWVVSSFTESDVHELFQLRRSLEPLGIDALQRDPDPGHIKELSGFFDPYSRPISQGRYPQYFSRDAAFHKRIIEVSGNERLVRMYGVLETHIDRGRYFLSLGSTGRVGATLDEHRAVTDAIAARDFDAARSALLHHLDMGEHLMVDWLRERDQA